MNYYTLRELLERFKETGIAYCHDVLSRILGEHRYGAYLHTRDEKAEERFFDELCCPKCRELIFEDLKDEDVLQFLKTGKPPFQP